MHLLWIQTVNFMGFYLHFDIIIGVYWNLTRNQVEMREFNYCRLRIPNEVYV